MKKESGKHHIEILPAALLSQRRAWQGVAHSLPVGACLLVINPKNKPQAKFMQVLARSFRENGRQIIIWTVGQRGVE